MKNSKERLSVTGKMAEDGANVAGIMLAFSAAAFMVLGGIAVVLHAIH